MPSVPFAVPKKPLKFKPVWRTPKTLITVWPPPDAAKPYNIVDSDNWQSVAVGHGFFDPWDIIIFNFRTDVPEEVNWYMHQLLGCTESNDGKNFSFRGAERGRLFIPPADWIPDREFRRGSFSYRLLRQSVLRDLDAIIPVLKALRYRGFTVEPQDYRDLQTAIRDGRVTVKLVTDLKDSGGHALNGLYTSKKNLLRLRSYMPGRRSDKETLVHELTHAVYDLHAHPEILFHHEMMCRVMEGVYRFSRRRFSQEMLATRLIEAARKGEAAHAAAFMSYVIWTWHHDDPVIDIDALDATYYNPAIMADDNPYIRMWTRLANSPAYQQPSYWEYLEPDGI